MLAGALPLGLLLVGLSILPESPRWLVSPAPRLVSGRCKRGVRQGALYRAPSAE